MSTVMNNQTREEAHAEVDEEVAYMTKWNPERSDALSHIGEMYKKHWVDRFYLDNPSTTEVQHYNDTQHFQ